MKWHKPDPHVELQVKQYVATVVNGLGLRFHVYTTGDPTCYLFCPLMSGETDIEGGLQVPVKKTDLRDDIRKMLAHGYGNSSYIGGTPWTPRWIPSSGDATPAVSRTPSSGS